MKKQRMMIIYFNLLIPGIEKERQIDSKKKDR
jgi:hypothetical protein